MFYFDYSANYPVLDEVLSEFVKVEKEARGNANSIHEEGKRAYHLYSEANAKIFSLLHLDQNNYEIIYTSSATESNNLATKGVYRSYHGKGNKMLASEFEHSSTNAALGSLVDEGAIVNLVSSTAQGEIDLDDLKKKLTDDTILTCLSYVEGELGAIQPVEKTQQIVNENSHSLLLVDATQAIGKIPVNLSSFDMVSFAPHKFGGIIGTGALIKKKSIVLSPLLHGGSSISIYRSGTPAVGLIASISKALEIALRNQKENYEKTKKLQSLFLSLIHEEKGILINSFLDNPFIINLSVPTTPGMKMVSLLNERGFAISQKSACSIPNTPSKVVNCVYHDRKRASTSFRISLCSLVKKEEVVALANAIKEIAHGK